MKLAFFASMWGNEMNMAEAVEHTLSAEFDGVEGPAPETASERMELARRMQDNGLLYLTEITTGGSYVPDPRLMPEQHLEDLKRKLDISLPMQPLKVNVMFGLDAWPFEMQLDAFGRAIEVAQGLDMPMVFELHRSRSTFNPWVTRDLMLALPDLRLNCDFSHWCAVAERLVLNDDPQILNLCAERCGHMHARVGYEQGPQVPDPRAPEYWAALESHVRWWQQLAASQRETGQALFTITPEFGPDGYLQRAPFTQEPVGDLREINAWMMQYLHDVMNDPGW